MGRGSPGPLLPGPLPSGSNSDLRRIQVRVPASAEAQKEAELVPRQGGSGGLPQQTEPRAAKGGPQGAGCVSDVHHGAFGSPEC